MTSLFSKIKSLPDAPGVYFFLNSKGEILYIGKASSLRDRVKSYFSKDLFLSRSPLIEKMAGESSDIKFQKTDSVLEALILEANLIKKHQPKYNTQEKDDKSWNYVVITDEEFPRVLLVRGKDLKDGLPAQIASQFVAGPFPHGSQLQGALKIIRKIFPFRDQKTRNPHTERFFQEIGLSPKTDGEEARKKYRRTIRHIKLFFEGKKKGLIKELEEEMKAEARKQNFEKAKELRNKIFALKHIQDVSLIKNQQFLRYDIMIYHTKKQKPFRVETYDVAHISGKFIVGAMVVMEGGEFKKSEYRKFKIKVTEGGDSAALREIIKRRLNHKEWPLPDLISVDGGLIQKRAAEKVVKESGLEIPVISVVKDEKHRPRKVLGDKKFAHKYEEEILRGNIEAHRFTISYHKKLREKID